MNEQARIKDKQTDEIAGVISTISFVCGIFSAIFGNYGLAIFCAIIFAAMVVGLELSAIKKAIWDEEANQKRTNRREA
ncbi:MAG: hypothetical protein MUO31_06955 [Thermodesulfovibrionales bacterium]|nr:hypothetical protein [Thermodesulfovibrionales bacterium]